MTPPPPPGAAASRQGGPFAKRDGAKGALSRDGKVSRGGPGNCAVCNHPKGDQIDADLVAGRPLRELAKRYGMSIMALSRHRRAHLTDALVKVQAGKPAAGDGSFISSLDALIARAEKQLAAAEKSRRGALALAAIRELGRLNELRGKATGELDERPTTVINLQTTQEWIQIRSIVVEFVPPERRLEFSQRLQLLEGGAAS